MKKIIRDIKISHTFIVGTLFAILVIGGLDYFNITQLRMSRDLITTIKDEKVEPLIRLNKIKDSYAIKIVDACNKVIHNEQSWEEGLKTIQNSRKEIEREWGLFFAISKNSENKEKILKVYDLRIKADRILDRIELVMLSQDMATMDQLTNQELYATVESLTNAVLEVILKQNEQISNIAIENEAMYNAYFRQTIIIGVSVVLLLFSLAVFVVTTLNASLKRANHSIKQISEGDLTVDIQDYGNDEVGEILKNIKSLITNLRPIIEHINSAASNISITSHELSTNSQIISQGATEQAASVEQIASSMEEISSNIIQNSKNAQITEQISIQAGIEFENGREIIDTTVEAIQNIAAKISIIGEIAFQTNILALNAAVEAARAGEHGKGFGVVAAEVGKLAERSKIAAAEINALSKSGVALSLKSKELLNIAVPNISKTANLVKQINQTSTEQNIGVNQINSGIQTLNHVTQQNAAASEEMATVAEEMSAQAEQLSQRISFFKIGKAKVQKQKKEVAPKYLQQKLNPKNPKTEKRKGIEIKMGNNDNLDNEFETF